MRLRDRAIIKSKKDRVQKLNAFFFENKQNNFKLIEMKALRINSAH